MTKRKRELLKLREGDAGLKIRKDGQIELAGLQHRPMIEKNGSINPVVLFAAAWTRRDEKVLQVLVDNFKAAVKEGFFGEQAKNDFIMAEKRLKETELNKKVKGDAPAFVKEAVVEHLAEPVLDPDSKPRVIDHDPIGNEFETMADTASGAVTLTDGGCGNADSDSGAVTFEQPKPYDVDGMLKGRDS